MLSQLVAKLKSVDDVAVMSQSQFHVAVARKDRLGVLDMSGTGGGIAGVADGNAVPAGTMFPPGFLSCDNVDGYSHDPATARTLLAEARYKEDDGDGIVEKDGTPLELILQTYPE